MVSLREFHLLGNGMDKLELSKVDKNIPSDNTCAEALHQEGASCLPPLEAALSLICMVVAFRLSGTLGYAYVFTHVYSNLLQTKVAGLVYFNAVQFSV